MRLPAVFLAALAVLAGLVTLAGCQPDSSTGAIGVQDPWIRAVPPTASATAGYFVLENGSGEDVVLEAVTATGIPRVEIHETTMADGVMRMRRLDTVAIAAGETATFAPGGRHLMLFADPLPAAGSTVTVELAFADGRVLAFEAPVRRGAD
ncbi:copper chaperone PCu(A)C [Lentisalinibacter sediminis]|uniref:copper chaperone PCu(A)C n=1 Tax=Lentisalinibacter sediminis TaxID=2992237 RepID=UPI003862FC41